MRIGIDLSGASSMLRIVLEAAVAEIDGAEVTRLPAPGPFDAVLLCSDGPDARAMPGVRADRFVLVSPRADTVWIVRAGRVEATLKNASHGMIRAALLGEEPQGTSGMPRVRRWLGRTPPAPAPDQPAHEPPPAMAALNGWLAARILAAGRGGLPPECAATLERAAGGLAPGRRPADPPVPGLARIVAAFGLDAAERDLLLAASIVEASPEAARLMGMAGGHAGPRRMMLGQAALLGIEPVECLARLRRDGPLLDFGLLELGGDGPLVAREIAAPLDVTAFVLGRPDAAALPLRRLGDDPHGAPPPNGIADRVASAARALSARVDPPVVIITGAADSGRRDVARTLAAATRRVAIETAPGDLAGPESRTALRRTARLHAAAVILADPSADGDGFRWDDLLRGVEGPVFVIAAMGAFAPLAARIERPAIPLDLPRRGVPERAELWRRAVPALAPEDHARIASRFDLGRAGVDRALRLAVSSAGIEGRTAPDQADLLAACDTLRAVEFNGAARRLPCGFRRSDIVLRRATEAELDLAIAWARHGARLFGADGPGRALSAGVGLACLFSGPPGTGKTMAAQIVAREVDFALYRIDISQIVDKYIGESEKRLAALFDEAERAHVALFFDEADACFGKRTEMRDSHDRYANTTVDFLLQRLESFEGLAILATNLVGNMDDAFLRRIQVRAEFLPPGPAERRLIWERLLPPADARADDIDLAILADAFELVGGEIRNALYTAHLLAAGEGIPLAMCHCVRGLWRELAKIGRLSDVGRLGAWAHLVTDEVGLPRLQVQRGRMG